MNGIYVHIPYCASKCHYCDFNSYALGQAKTEPYVRALIREIEATASEIPPETPFETVFFGGGTPTACSAEQLVRILDALRAHYRIAPDAEITSEGNPGTVTAEGLAVMRAGGFNRMSFGVQAFDDAMLRSLGRIHTVQQAIEAVEAVRVAGFTHYNIDLMFGLPGQTLSAFEETLRRAFALEVPHLSIYGLIVEEGTAFGRWYELGKLTLPGEEIERRMFDMVLEQTAAHGYEPYEVSNFARPGHRCVHNQIYWRNEPYLGLGAGAVAYWNGVRRTNCLLPGEYVRRVREGKPLAIEEERLTPREALGETLMLGLRMTDGVNLHALQDRFGPEPLRPYAAHIRRMTERGFLTMDRDTMKLTPAGLPLANEVWAGFVA